MSVGHKIGIFLRAERHRREARREKFFHENCTISTIHLCPPGPSDDDDDDDDDDDNDDDDGDDDVR